MTVVTMVGGSDSAAAIERVAARIVLVKLFQYWRLQDEAQCRRELYDYQVPSIRSLELPTVCVSTNGDQPEIGVAPPGW
jgi:hypothetical protein